jgi:hypothetical protein
MFINDHLAEQLHGIANKNNAEQRQVASKYSAWFYDKEDADKFREDAWNLPQNFVITGPKKNDDMWLVEVIG